MIHSMYEAWGMRAFDEEYTGLPKGVFNLLRTCNQETNIAAMGHFLEEGIRRGEKVVLVGFENPLHLAEKFQKYAFSFEDVLLSEQLIYLYYKSSFSYSMSFNTDYSILFHEINNLANQDADRVGFFNVDVLFNLQSFLLARSSAEKIISSLTDQNMLMLGSYQSTKTIEHNNLDVVSKIALSSYMDITPRRADGYSYELTWRKSLGPHALDSIPLSLHIGYGFNYSGLPSLKHG